MGLKLGWIQQAEQNGHEIASHKECELIKDLKNQLNQKAKICVISFGYEEIKKCFIYMTPKIQVK